MMVTDEPSILIHADQVICNASHRQHLEGTPRYWWPSLVAKDEPVEGAIPLLDDLAKTFRLVYMFSRPPHALRASVERLGQENFPGGLVLIGETDADRTKTLMRAMDEFKYNIVLAIGTDKDEAMRLKRLGITSVVLQEKAPELAAVRKFIAKSPWADLPAQEVEVYRCAECGEEHSAEGFIRLDFFRDKKRGKKVAKVAKQP